MIQNGSSKTLSQNSGTMPNMSGAFQGWVQKMTFTLVGKIVENFKVVETPTEIQFSGVWQPLSNQRIMQKPEGQRAWKWYQVHSETNVNLEVDHIISYLGVQYRVMARGDYKLYGYFHFELIEDFTGSGP